VSGLRPSPRIRAQRLAEKVRRREIQERRKGLSAPELAWERALELAPAGEIGELDGLVALSRTQQPETWSMFETLQRMWELMERIMYRSAPTLAASFRERRCLLVGGLEGAQEEATEAFEARVFRRPPEGLDAADAGDAAGAGAEHPWRLMQRRNALSTALINRKRAIQAGAEPITDVEEALGLLAEVLEAVDAADRDQMLRLVRRR
jgi:hypothetical protein